MKPIPVLLLSTSNSTTGLSGIFSGFAWSTRLAGQYNAIVYASAAQLSSLKTTMPATVKGVVMFGRSLEGVKPIMDAYFAAPSGNGVLAYDH
jgi:hypothetical protein